MKTLFFTLLFTLSLNASTKFCIIGDGGDNSTLQYNVAKALLKEDCKKILYTGDVIYEEGLKSIDDPNFISKFYTPYKPLLDSGSTFYMSMGNHDWYNGASGKYWVELSRKYPSIVYPEYFYTQETDGVCIISIETDQSNLFDQQVDWFKEIKPLLSCKFSIAFGHVPYWSYGKHGNANFSTKKFLEEMVLGSVDLYVAGHDHILADAGQKDGTKLLVSGCAGKVDPLWWKPNVWAMGRVSGLLVVEVSENRANFKFIVVKGTYSEVRHTGTIEGVGIR